MKLSEINIPVSSLSGAGPRTVKCLSNLNIFTVGDLLKFYPKDYEDRTKRIPLDQFRTAKKVHTVAKVLSHEYFGAGRMKTLKINIQDESARASLIAFNRSFLERTLPVGSIISVTGSFDIKYNSLQSSSFEATLLKEDGALEEFSDYILPDTKIIPVYHLTQGLTQKTITKLINNALLHYAIGLDNEIPEKIIESRNLLNKTDAIKKIHSPENFSELKKAKETLVYEELFNFEKTMILRAIEHKGSIPDPDITEDSSFDENIKTDFSPRQTKLLESLSFTLTKDQLKVINQMNAEIDRGYKERTTLLKKIESDQNLNKASIKPPFTMQRLVQGDVGSGKTLIALFASLRVIDWGGQVAFMAPTEILARQHAENISQYVEKFGVRTAFLTGNVKAAGRTTLLKALKAGNIDILIGTHALFSRDVFYKDLQLAIIDEQHRFGVLQRQAIVEKGRQLFNTTYAGPHLIMMSATPIPQTLALTAFGDLDVSVIKTLPQGRKPIITYLVSEEHESNAFNAVRQEIEKGHQAYFVYPAIEENYDNEESENDEELEFSGTTENIKSAEKAFKEMSAAYFSKYKCALLHSKISEELESRILDDFRYGKIQILFATTVVEVGVDVPNATCMVIEQADRFGLSQLHQLRGRVGRGASQGFCFLVFRNKLTDSGIQRMKILRESTDGFYIAEEDLKLRGPGEIAGTIQSGALQLEIADLSRDREILFAARKDAIAFIKNKDLPH